MTAVLGEVGDRIVVVSSSVKALDVISIMCSSHGWTTTRIDGSTSTEQRQELVTSFNLYQSAQVE